MEKNGKSKYYWDVTRNMSWEQEQEYLRKQKKEVKQIINKKNKI